MATHRDSIERAAEILASALVSPNALDSNLEPGNVVDGLFEVATAVRRAAHLLGTGNAGTEMGAIEAHMVAVKEAGEAVERGLCEAGQAIERGLDGVASAIRDLAREAK